jgi:hypothetical protein
MYISREVVLHETQFPFATSSSHIESSAAQLAPFIPPLHIPAHSPTHPPPPPTASNITPSTLSHSSFAEPSATHSSIEVPPPSRIHPMRTRAQNNIVQQWQLTNGTIRYPMPCVLLSETTLALVDPTCFLNVVTITEWRNAMQVEFNTLLQNHSWSLGPPMAAKNVVDYKWVFKLKRKADRSVKHHKARLVAKGFHQQARLDYGETYSPVVKPTTIRTILSIAYSAGWSLKQIDIQNAFLHGFLSKDVYMVQPPRFIHPSYPHHVCKLHKAFYGLKQAPRTWFSRLNEKLLQLGFTSSKADSSLFIYSNNSVTMYLLIYVDDIIITTSIPVAITELLQLLSVDFAIKDLGDLHYFLKVEVLSVHSGLLISQRRYILDLLKKTNTLEAKPITSPMAAFSILSAFTSDPMEDPSLYRNIVGFLQYLSLTRPNLGFAVNCVPVHA